MSSYNYYKSHDEAQEHYINIIEFQALQAATNEFWSGEPVTSDEDLADLKEYVNKIKDTRFRNKLGSAMCEYSNYEANVSGDDRKEEKGTLYETTTFSIHLVPHFAERRYGVHFKDTNEFGLYTVFHGDRDEPYTGFYRSDRSFQQEIVLDDLLADEPI